MCSLGAHRAAACGVLAARYPSVSYAVQRPKFHQRIDPWLRTRVQRQRELRTRVRSSCGVSGSGGDAGEYLKRHGTSKSFSEDTGAQGTCAEERQPLALPQESTAVDGDHQASLDLGLTVVNVDGSLSFFENWSEKTEEEKLAIARVVIPRNRKRLAQLRQKQLEEQEQDPSQ